MSKLTIIAFGRVKAGHEAGLSEVLKEGQAKSLQEPGTEVYKGIYLLLDTEQGRLTSQQPSS
jgi:hypothetical protein